MENGPSKTSSEREGFTLIELSFAILFIAVLLLTIALITIQIVGNYRKGLSMKATNETGRELIEDLRTSVINSPSSVSSASLCSGLNDADYTNCAAAGLSNASGQAAKMIYRSFRSNNNITSLSTGATATKPELGGVFCTGEYTYIWNTGYSFSSDYRGAIFSLNLSGSTNPSFPDGYKPHMFRIVDPSRAVCRHLYSTNDTLSSNLTIDLNALSLGDRAQNELISSPSSTDTQRTDAPLAIYEFTVNPPAYSEISSRVLYTGSFYLGTTSGGVDIQSSNPQCKKEAADSSFNSDYCAVNKFNFVAQTTSL